MFKRDLPLEAVKERYSDEQSKFISIDGVDIHYKDEGTGAPLLLIHSLNTSLLDWEDWTMELKDHFRVIRLDLPGFGLSEYHKDFDFQLDSYIYFLKKFIAHLKLTNILLGGVAWGADISWHYATLSPYLVNKLVLVNPSDHPNYHPPFYQKLSKHWFGKAIFRWTGSKGIVKKRAKKWFHSTENLNDETLERFQIMLLKEGNRKAFIATNNGFHRNRYKRLSALKVNTLLVCSEELGKNPMEKQLPNSTSIYYKNTRNYPMIEQAQQSSKDVLDFLKK